MKLYFFLSLTVNLTFLHSSEISGTLISPVDIIGASYCIEKSLLIISPLNKRMEHSNAALWTIQHSEFWRF